MAAPDFGYQLEAAYATPVNRLRERYRIDIKNYISRVTTLDETSRKVSGLRPTTARA